MDDLEKRLRIVEAELRVLENSVASQKEYFKEKIGELKGSFDRLAEAVEQSNKLIASLNTQGAVTGFATSSQEKMIWGVVVFICSCIAFVGGKFL